VCKSLCIGSDLDGIVDALNFPHPRGSRTVDENNWVEANEYRLLEEELVTSLERLKKKDPFLDEALTNAVALASDVMYRNGMAFLEKNFR
jgi:hypothetical protein